MLNIVFIWFGKLLSLGLRATGRHGAALPGLIIERLHPKFLPSMLAKLPQGVVVVTGTNGKTTTTKMISELLRSQGQRVLTNKSGGNFVRGVISTVVQSAKLGGGLSYDIAVMEQDEAYAVKFSQLFAPTAVVALNVTRDQLDRFGEIDTTAALLQEVAKSASKLVVLNDDDTRLTKLEVPTKAKAIYYGIDKALQPQFPNDEQLYGRQAAAVGQQHQRTVQLKSLTANKVEYEIGGQTKTVNLQIDGPHNALNAAAALATVIGLYPQADIGQLLDSLQTIKAAFGRGELIDYQGRTFILQLVKNPASFAQALHVLDIHKPAVASIVINDDYADGRDVSWLWDVDFKALSATPLIASGSRGYDMANRLKYDDKKVEAVTPSLNEMLAQLARQTPPGSSAIIFATYTAMLAVRRAIGRTAKLERV